MRRVGHGAPEEVDQGITETLHAIGEFVGVDRSYLFLAYDYETKVNNTHEWCAPGIAPQISTLQGLRAEDFPWIAERLLRLHNFQIVGHARHETIARLLQFLASQVDGIARDFYLPRRGAYVKKP